MQEIPKVEPITMELAQPVIATDFQIDLLIAIDDWKEDKENAWLKLSKLLARAYDKEHDKTIYKHQCGHCKRFSPLPFLIPGDLINGQD